jgi:presenilin-like A22 family membrane protease
MDLRLELFLIYAYTVMLSAILGAMIMSMTPVGMAELQQISPTGGGQIVDAIAIFLYVVFGAVLFIAISKLGLIKYAMRLVEIMSIFASFAIAGAVISQYIGVAPEAAGMLGLLSGAAVSVRRLLFQMERNNIYGIVVSAVLGALFGTMMGIWAVFLFAALMIVYDFVAVFMTKHMIDIAKAVVVNNIAMVVTVSRPGAEADFSENKDLARTKRIDLGTGDLFIAGMMVVCSMKYGSMLYFALPASFLGFALTMELLRRMRRPIPALPTIAGTIMAAMLAYVALAPLF